MERQRTVKTTRFLVFSLTISFCLTFFVFLSIWVFKASPSAHEQPLIQFEKPALSLGLEPLTVQTLKAALSENEATNPIGLHIHHGRAQNSSEFANASSLEEEEEDEDGAKNGNFTSTGSELSASSNTINSIRTSNLPRKPENTSAFAKGLTVEKLHEKENESEILVRATRVVDVVSDNLRPRKKNLFDASFQKTEVLDSARIKENNGWTCDVARGRWVFDESYPLYTNRSCPFIDEGFNCEGNGRLDKQYMKWRWLPVDCDIPRYYNWYFIIISIAFSHQQ